MKNIIRISLFSFFSIIPEFSWSCSVCGGSLTEEKAAAYLAITGLLVSMPVLMLGILGVWIYHRYKQTDCISPAG